ncbi:hypothetical protein GGR52DRAFT_573734 [Hypoxylon sp. FL1284]|nr:hypothetical protein GGR52DRAFT_573734 [Hypoxylon sp. FL1284]
MSTASAETSKQYPYRSQHHNRSRSRSRSPSESRSRPQPAKPKPKKRKKKGNTLKKTKREPKDLGWFAIRGIIKEKSDKRKTYYLVDWEGTDTNGQPHKPSWEPEENVTDVAVEAWRDRAATTQLRDHSSAAINHSSQDSTQLSTQESNPIPPPNWHRQIRDKKRALEHPPISDSESNHDNRQKRQRLYKKSSLELLKGARSGLEVGNQPQDKLQVGSKQETGLAGTELREIQDSSKHRIVVELSRDPLINPLDFSRLTSSQETAAGSKISPNSSRSLTAQAHEVKIRRDEHQIIPDSQGTSQETISSSLSKYQLGADTHVLKTAKAESQEEPCANSDKASWQPSNSQAAQIVVPLNSQHDQLAAQSRDNFTVYDDPASPSTVSKAHVQSTSQHPSQALSELDGNTRSAPSSNPVELESQAPSHLDLSQSESEKHVDLSGAQESSAGQSFVATSARPAGIIYAPQQSIAPINMDDTQATPRSARERLRALREPQFALLNASSQPSNSDGAIQSGDQMDSSTVPQADGQGLQTLEFPPPDISPLTPTPLVSPTFLSQPLPTAPEASSNETHSLIPETTQLPMGQEQHAESSLEDSGPAISYGAPSEEQPITLDPSNLTLSIENDMDLTPSIPLGTTDGLSSSIPVVDNFIRHEEVDIPQYYPTSLLPYVPAGAGEYLVTLPFHNSVRPVYNDIIRENEELIRDYNNSFRVLPYQKPHRTTVAKLDEMFSRLLDVCDLPPFMETIPSMDPGQVTKHLLNTNAKYAFVAEFLRLLAETDSDKKILILARPGKVIDFLGQIVETRGYQYIRSGLEIVGSSSAQHSLSVAISSTLDSASSIPEDVDVVIGFDHTYRKEVLPASIRERSPILMVLANMCSIQHINMRIADNIEPLERKNVLALSLVKAMRYVEDADESLVAKLPEAAETFAKHIMFPDDDDFYWEPLEVPEDVFEDLHAASSQLVSQLSLPVLGNGQLPESRKRSHEVDEDDETSSKRLRMSQPAVVTNISHISDDVKDLIGDDFTDDSSKAAFSVSVNKLEALAAEVASLKAKLEESRRQEKTFRDLSDRSKREVDDYSSTVRRLQDQYMVALKDRGIYEAEYHKAKEEASALGIALDSSKEQHRKLKERNAEVEKKLSEANELLLNSSNPDLARMAHLEEEVAEMKKKAQQLEKKATLAESDMEYTKRAYQDASQSAAQLQSENLALEQQVKELRRKADDNVVEVNRIQAKNEVRELVRMLDEQRSIVRDRDLELGRARDELRLLKENRRGTRQSSVPRSPRLSAFTNAANSPRNNSGAGRTNRGSSSRGTSPAPPPTGVFETGSASATPAPGNRHSHLREQF